MKTIKDQDHFEVLRKIDKDPKTSQRKMAGDLGFSLGKLNYSLKALQKKGLVKIKNFQNKPDKIKATTPILSLGRGNSPTTISSNRKQTEAEEVV